jgi:predicted nucleic acid-binding Zn ribbon protein
MQRLGGLPGMIAALHTWDDQLLLHPHLHCLVTGGGLSPDGEWRASRADFLVHVHPLMHRFRHLFCRAVERELRKHALVLPEGERLQTLLNTIHRVNRTDWEVFIAKPPEAGGPSSDEVLRYQAKAVAGGPVSDVRLETQLQYITEVAGADFRLHDSTVSEVTIRYGAYNPQTQRRERNQVLTLPMDEFLQRLLLHVPPPSTQTVRSYGLYASAKTDALEQSRVLLPSARPVPPTPSDATTTTDSTKALSLEDYAEQRAQCPVCGKALVMTRRLPSSITGKLPHRPVKQACGRGG